MGVLSNWLARLTVNQVRKTWRFKSFNSHDVLFEIFLPFNVDCIEIIIIFVCHYSLSK